MFRQYQFDNELAIEASWNAGNRFVLYVLPTGGGKSEVVTNIHRRQRSANVVIAHREELVSQMSLHLARKSVFHRIIAPKKIIAAAVKDHRDELGSSFYSPSALASVAGIDTLISRKADLEPWAQQIGLWSLDEAHHLLLANKWGEGVTMFPNAKGLGVTATPKRGDGKGLGVLSDGVFQDLVLGPTMRELINDGYLSDYEIVVPDSDFDISTGKLGSNGDYTQASMREASRKSRIVGNAVIEYYKYALAKQAIVFATDIETADKMAEEFNRCGIIAASVSSKTDDGERRKKIKAFRERQITVLVNVDLFGEGFDVPAVECVIMARPTKSLAVFLQQFGRALRVMSGKVRALIIDLVSNIYEHGLPDRPRFWSLDGRERKRRSKDDDGFIPVTVCTNCKKPYERFHRRCPHCGFLPVPMGGTRAPEAVDGDLLLLDTDVLEKMRKAMILEAPGALAGRVGAAAGSFAAKQAQTRQVERLEAQAALREAIALWAGRGAVEGKDHPELYRRFFFKYGVDVFSALSLPREEMETIRMKIEASA